MTMPADDRRRGRRPSRGPAARPARPAAGRRSTSCPRRTRGRRRRRTSPSATDRRRRQRQRRGACSVSMSRPTRMMSASENRRSRRPYERVPTIPPTAIAVVSSPKPTASMPEPLAGVQDEHRPRRAERDVEGEDRERERPHRRVCQQPAEPLGHVRRRMLDRLARRLARRRLVTTRRRAARRARSRPRWSRTAAPCRRRTGTRRSAARRAGSSAGTRPAAGRSRCPGPRAATSRGRSVLLAESANVSAVPRTNSATRTTAMLDRAADDRGREQPPGRRARTRLTTTTIRRRSNRSATAPASTPNRSGGRSGSRASETRNGSLVCEATSSGPGGERDPVADVGDDGRRRAASGSSGRGAAGRRSRRRGRTGTARREDTGGSAPGNGPLVERHDPAGQAPPVTSTRPASRMISAIRSGDG